MKLELLKAIVVLPGTVLVFVPALVLRLASDSPVDMSPRRGSEARARPRAVRVSG